jgi:hypothetical protein
MDRLQEGKCFASAENQKERATLGSEVVEVAMSTTAAL